MMTGLAREQVGSCPVAGLRGAPDAALAQPARMSTIQSSGRAARGWRLVATIGLGNGKSRAMSRTTWLSFMNRLVEERGDSIALAAT